MQQQLDLGGQSRLVTRPTAAGTHLLWIEAAPQGDAIANLSSPQIQEFRTRALVLLRSTSPNLLKELMPPKLFILDGQIIFIHRKHFLSLQFFSNWNMSHCTVSPRSVLEPNCPHGWSAMSGTLLSQSQIVPIYWGLTHYVAISRVQFFTAALRQIALTVHWNTSGPLCWALRRPEEHSWRWFRQVQGWLILVV